MLSSVCASYPKNRAEITRNRLGEPVLTSSIYERLISKFSRLLYITVIYLYCLPSPLFITVQVFFYPHSLPDILAKPIPTPATLLSRLRNYSIGECG
jgi:hypothetical protein